RHVRGGYWRYRDGAGVRLDRGAAGGVLHVRRPSAAPGRRRPADRAAARAARPGPHVARGRSRTPDRAGRERTGHPPTAMSGLIEVYGLTGSLGSVAPWFFAADVMSAWPGRVSVSSSRLMPSGQQGDGDEQAEAAENDRSGGRGERRQG